MRVWSQKPQNKVVDGVDVDDVFRSPLISMALAKTLLRELGEVYLGFWDYEQTVGLMYPVTKRAVYLSRNYPRYAATEADTERLLSYLKTPRSGDEDEEIDTALINGDSVVYPRNCYISYSAQHPCLSVGASRGDVLLKHFHISTLADIGVAKEAIRKAVQEQHPKTGAEGEIKVNILFFAEVR